MNMLDVSSSTVRSIGYDVQTKTLVVVFLSGGEYQYHDVPLETWEGFLKACSMGRYFHQMIKGRFGYGKRQAPHPAENCVSPGDLG